MNIKDELYLHIQELQDEIERNYHELQYMYDFLAWKNISDEYAYFRVNAHLEQNDDEPFPRYVL